jgi:hypothetical protein
MKRNETLGGVGCVLSAAACALVLWGCSEEGKRPIGSTCDGSEQCASGLCLEGECVDPLGDADGDGLLNAVEYDLGSDALLQDSDADGILDPSELGEGFALVDTDGDAKADILESATRDNDGDCIPDQYDADDATPNTDLSPMIAVVCPRVGVCAADGAVLGAVCPNGRDALCVFEGVPGYANPEATCDGRDENCDGQTDETFPGGCRSIGFLTPGSGGREVATARHRATLVFGQPALGTGTTATSRHRAIIGGNPVLSPSPTEAP